MQALAGLAALLRRPAGDLPGLDRAGLDRAGPDRAGLDPDDPLVVEARRAMLHLAEDGGIAAARVLAYLREQRGNGDGELAAVPPRLGQWREWVPPRGHLFGVTDTMSRTPNEVPHPRRSEPGE